MIFFKRTYVTVHNLHKFSADLKAREIRYMCDFKKNVKIIVNNILFLSLFPEKEVCTCSVGRLIDQICPSAKMNTL